MVKPIAYGSQGWRGLGMSNLLFSSIFVVSIILIVHQAIARAVSRQLLSSINVRGTSKCDEQKSYNLSSDESYGFFDDIDDESWTRMQSKNRAAGIFNHPEDPNFELDDLAVWMLDNVDPTFTCPHMQRVGGKADGPKWTCDPHRLAKKGPSDCLIYSVGSKGNYMFEDGLVDILRQENGNNFSNCEIHVFDPDPSYVRPNDVSDNNIHYHALGFISSYNETMSHQFGGYAFKSFPDVISMLGHENRHIDILKIDCEGCEFATYRDWLRADIGQILVEVHPHVIGAWNWNTESLPRFFSDFYKEGFAIFAKEANTNPYALPLGTMFEIGFIKLKQSFHGQSNRFH